MTSAEYYRREAERCRQMAEATKDPEAARRRRALANDYHSIADDLEGVPHSLHLTRIPIQSQPGERKAKTGEKT